jgi:hypothetical protein
MSHYGNNFALSQRDKIVHSAVTSDKASINYQSGNNFTAALYDCAENILFAAVPQTVMGFGIVFPYFTVTYQGWVGGIVSVNDSRQSRFDNIKSAAYYLIVAFLQFIPFSMSIGAGIKCGIDFYKYNSKVSWKIWNYRIPKASLQDIGYVYLVTIPLFFVASCFEFFSSWNIWV